MPRLDDVFQERLYCIRWAKQVEINGRKELIRRYAAPTEADLKRKEKVLALLRERFADWQAKGYLPSRRIEAGDETTRLMRERGWMQKRWPNPAEAGRSPRCGMFGPGRRTLWPVPQGPRWSGWLVDY